MDQQTKNGQSALEYLMAAVERIAPDEWDRPSNLEGWTVRDVVAHVTGSVAKLAALLEDSPTAGGPSDPSVWYAEDQVARLRQEADRASKLLPTADPEALRKGPGGELPLRITMLFPLTDAVVHAWDIDRSCGREGDVPPELLGMIQALVAELGDVTKNSPAFGEPAPCPTDATPTQQLMTRLGRRVD